MKVSEILTSVASNLGDSAMVQFPQTMLLKSLQEGYNLIVASTQCIERSANFPQIARQVYYDLAKYLPDFCVVSAIFNYNTNRWLLPVHRRVMNQYRWDWEIMNGEPRWFDVVNWRYICVMPTPAVASGGFEIFYKAKANKLTLDSIPLIPSQFVRILENYVTSDMFFANREFHKGIPYFKQIEPDIKKIKRLVKLKASSDRLNTLSPSVGMGTYAFTGADMWQANETPNGTMDGVNTAFTLIQVPNPTSTLMLFKNGQKLDAGVGFAMINNVILFNTGFAPGVGDTLTAWYQMSGFPGGSIASGTWKSEIPTGAIDGVNGTYVLTFFPSPTNNMLVFKNGQALLLNTGFTITGNTIAIQANYILGPTDTLVIVYQY